MAERDWNPVRNGDVFCSPTCGYGCKVDDYIAAVQKADKLADRLGPAWRPRVWENLGWHYSAKRGKCEVREVSHCCYDANFVSASQFQGQGATPQDAVQDALDKAREKISTILADIEDLGY